MVFYGGPSWRRLLAEQNGYSLIANLTLLHRRGAGMNSVLLRLLRILHSILISSL